MKHIIKLISYFSIFLISGFATAQNTLDNYLKEAAENNPGLKAKFNAYMATLERIPQVGALPDPTVAFGYFIQPVETRVGPQKMKFSANQMFPWFGTLGAKKDVVTQKAKAGYETFEEAKSRLFYDVKSTWYNLYFTRKAINITRENIEILNTFRNLALIRIESGQASAVDELRVQMEILDLENQLKLLSDKYNAQQVAFNNFLNTNENKKVVIPNQLDADSLSVSEEAIRDSIRSKNHQLLSLEFQKATYAFQQTVARKAGSPKFNIGLDYTIIDKPSGDMVTSDAGQDAFMFPKIGITIPIYRKKYSSMVKEAVFMQQSVEQKAINKVNILENIFERANNDYKNAVRRIDLHTKQLNLAQKAMRILESQYANDGKNFEEILRMERQVLLHSMELEKSLTDVNASIAFINYLMGK